MYGVCAGLFCFCCAHVHARGVKGEFTFTPLGCVSGLPGVIARGMTHDNEAAGDRNPKVTTARPDPMKAMQIFCCGNSVQGQYSI